MPLALMGIFKYPKGGKSWKELFDTYTFTVLFKHCFGLFLFPSCNGVFWLSEVIREKEWNLPFLLAIIYMTIYLLIVEYRLVFSFLFDSGAKQQG